MSRRNKSAREFSRVVTCTASPRDIEWINGGKKRLGVEVFAVYMQKEEKVRLVKYSENIEISLDPFSFELLTVSPVMVLSEKLVQFAVIGLVNMLNCGGAIQWVEISEEHEKWVRVGVRGCGEMRVFASEKPAGVKIGGNDVRFEYEDNMVRTNVPWSGSSSKLCVVEYSF